MAVAALIALIGSRLFPPFWTAYVAGHELTHALWALLFGKRVKAIKVRKSGGHVVLSGTNSLITLAPYFFPFYAVIWLGFATVANRWRTSVVPSWLLASGFGAAYAMHVLMTAKVLRFRQPDIESEGYLFSAVVVALGNLAMALLLIPIAVGTGDFVEIATMAWDRAGQCIDWAVVFAGRLAELAGAPLGHGK